MYRSVFRTLYEIVETKSQPERQILICILTSGMVFSRLSTHEKEAFFSLLDELSGILDHCFRFEPNVVAVTGVDIFHLAPTSLLRRRLPRRQRELLYIVPCHRILKRLQSSFQPA